MKIIEALKKIKDLQRKASDIRELIGSCSAKMSFEDDRYDNQTVRIQKWMQSHHDLVIEIERLRDRVAKTNVMTNVTIEINGKLITKSIHSWISRRRDLCDLEISAWNRLTDKGLHPQAIRGTDSQSPKVIEFKVVRFFSPDERDNMLDELRSEKVLIDGKLEIINAITDLMD